MILVYILIILVLIGERGLAYLYPETAQAKKADQKTFFAIED